MAIFGTTDIPSDSIEVRSGSTVEVGVAFARTVGLVGGMDTANGSATTGEVVTVESSSDAAAKFGASSELKEAVDLVLNQTPPPNTIYAIPVAETTVTGEATGGATFTTANTPVFDPNIHDEHTVDVVDTGGTNPTTNIVYESPPSTPTEADTVNFNPVTGEGEADAAAAGTYEIDYVYGDYSSAIAAIAKKVPREVLVGTEATSVGNTLLTEMNNAASDFKFMHGQIGAMPETSASAYSDSFDDRRLSVVAPSRGYTDEASTNEQRTLWATGGKEAGKALGNSTTYESIAGFTELRTSYTNSELGTLVDKQVYPLKQGDRIFVVKDMTTSTDSKFERVYASEIIDEATDISHQISTEFVGDLNIETNRFALGESHASSYEEMEDDNLLDAYTVSVSEGATDSEVDVDIGIDVVNVMDTIDVTITVGDVIQNGGAT